MPSTQYLIWDRVRVNQNDSELLLLKIQVSDKKQIRR